MLVAAFTLGGPLASSRSPSSSSPSASRSRTFFVRLAGTVERLSSFITGTEESILPVIDKVGGSVDRVNGQLDKVDRITDSAVDAADSVDTAVRAVSLAVTRPVQKVSGLRRGRQLRRGRLQGAPRLAPRGAGGKEAAARRESDFGEELRDAGTCTDRRDPARHPGRGGLPPDRPPRHRRPRARGST